jgi:hypothetical protein
MWGNFAPELTNITKSFLGCAWIVPDVQITKLVIDLRGEDAFMTKPFQRLVKSAEASE